MAEEAKPSAMFNTRVCILESPRFYDILAFAVQDSRIASEWIAHRECIIVIAVARSVRVLAVVGREKADRFDF